MNTNLVIQWVCYSMVLLELEKPDLHNNLHNLWAFILLQMDLVLHSFVKS